MNEAEGMTIFAMYADDLVFDNCKFYHNKASSISKNIFTGFSTVKIRNTIFEDYSK